MLASSGYGFFFKQQNHTTQGGPQIEKKDITTTIAGIRPEELETEKGSHLENRVLRLCIHDNIHAVYAACVRCNGCMDKSQ